MGSMPTTFPPVCNLSRRTGSNDLIGRKDELDQLHSLLKSKHSVLLSQENMRAPGIGRSRLALEYAAIYGQEYQVVWRLDCGQAAVLMAHFAELAMPLKLPERAGDDQRVIVAALRDWLAKNKAWLLILEDLEDWSHLERVLPDAYGGHVIVTSVSLKADQGFEAVKIGGISNEATTKLLAAGSSKLDGEAARLGEYLGGIPQLLHLARSYCSTSSTSFGDLHSRLQADLSAAGIEEDSAASWEAKLHIILSLILSSVKKQESVARDLLALCAFFDSEDISFAMLSEGADCYSLHLREASQEESSIIKMGVILCEHGLVELSDTALSIHPQIQKAVREGMNEEPREAWANAALRCVLSSFPIKMDYEHPLPECNQLLPHAYATTRHTLALDIAPEDTGYLLNQVGLYLHGCNEYESASAAYEHAARLAEKAYGRLHAAVATRMNSLGVTYQEVGNLDKARKCYQVAFDICAEVFGPVSEAVYGPAHDTMLTMPIKNLCNVLEALGDYQTALKTYARAMPIYVEVYGWKHPIVAECANSFGDLWVKQGKFEKGRNCFRKAVAAEEKSEGGAQGNLSVYLRNLGNVMLKLQETDEAHAVFQRALELEREDFGDQSARVRTALINVGHTARKLRQYTEAQKCYEEALSIHESGDNVDPHGVAPILNFLGIVLQAQGEAAAAKEYFERALAHNEELGLQSPETLSKDYYNIARSLEDMEQYDEAIALFEKAIELQKSLSDGRTERAATILNRLGRVLRSQGKLPEALEHMERALSIDISLFGKAHVTVARDSFHIGSLLAQVGDTIVAMGHLTLALEIYETEYGKGHPRSRKTREKLDDIGN